ncbi:TPA: hypothetical protein QDB21_005626 [Burkholderia vietnamiensis]|nr:hypothetical protein [Burkholderia vietnamiensis]
MSDAIERSKRILSLVDAYHENPTQDTRTTLRKALMEEFEAAPSAADDKADAELLRGLLSLAWHWDVRAETNRRAASLSARFVASVTSYGPPNARRDIARLIEASKKHGGGEPQ